MADRQPADTGCHHETCGDEPRHRSDRSKDCKQDIQRGSRGEAGEEDTVGATMTLRGCRHEHDGGLGLRR